MVIGIESTGLQIRFHALPDLAEFAIHHAFRHGEACLIRELVQKGTLKPHAGHAIIFALQAFLHLGFQAGKIGLPDSLRQFIINGARHALLQLFRRDGE